MSKYIDFLRVNLQIFADGGSAAAGSDVSGDAGDPGVTAGITDQQAEQQPATAQEPEDLEAEFNELIKGKFKGVYGKRVQSTVQSRLKGTNDTIKRAHSYDPVHELLSQKYGVDAADAEGLLHAIEEDNSFYEDEALERGLSVEQLKQIKKMERENATLRRQMQDNQQRENADRIYSQWMSQADETREIYPSFDLDAEMQNEEFMKLLGSGIGVQTAYEVLHKDDILHAGMQYAAKTAERKVSNAVAANSRRPVENGASKGVPAKTSIDPSKLTNEQMDEYIRRARNGERITFKND